MREIKRGEIYYANLCPVIGSEQGGIRPVIILQNDTGNKFSPTTIVAAITSKDASRTANPCRNYCRRIKQKVYGVIGTN